MKEGRKLVSSLTLSLVCSSLSRLFFSLSRTSPSPTVLRLRPSSPELPFSLISTRKQHQLLENRPRLLWLQQIGAFIERKMVDDGRAVAVREEDRAELVRALQNILRVTDRLDTQLSTMASQLSTMASMLNEFSNPRSSAKSEAFKELEVTERQHTSGTFLSIFPKALTEIDHSLSQDENQPLTASATAPLHPPPLPKTTIVTDTSPKPQIPQFTNEILPSRNQIERPGLSAVFPIPHAPPGTPTLITQQTESSSVFLISPTSSSFTALTFEKLPQPVQSWALVQFPDATKLGKETMDELQPHPSHSPLTQTSTHINSAITTLTISSEPDFPLNFLQPNIIRAQDNKSIPPLRDKNCWCALDSKKLLLGAEQITAWRHRLNEGTIFLASLCGRVSLVECVAFDSTEVLVFAGATSGAIKLWDLQEFYPFGEFFVSGFAHTKWFGCVFKGWIEENGTAPARPGTGLTVAVKTLNHDGLQGHKNVASRFVVSFRAYWYQNCCKQYRHEEGTIVLPESYYCTRLENFKNVCFHYGGASTLHTVPFVYKSIQRRGGIVLLALLQPYQVIATDFLQAVASKKNQTQLWAHPSTFEHILSFKPAKDSGGADLAELGKTHVAILRYCRDASVLPSCCCSAERLLFYRDDTILFRIKLFTGSLARRDMYMEEITPMRQAPAIAHGEFKPFESHAILTYPACAFPTVAGHWYPTDLFKRAKIHSVLDWPHTNLRRGSVEYLLNAPLALFFCLPLNPQAAAEGEKVLIASMSKIESFWLHEDGKFLLGNDQPSIADLSPLSEVMQLEVMLDQIGSYELNHILAHSQRLNSDSIASFVKDSLAFETMKKIVREYFPFTTETEPMNFTGCVRCLITFTSSRFNSDVSLNAIAFLKFCASKLAEVGLVCNKVREDACSYILAGTEGGFDGHDFTTKELGALNKGAFARTRGNEWSYDKCRRQWDPRKYCVALDPDALQFYLCV